MTASRSGWHPCRLACWNCDAGEQPDCPICSGSGWCNSHVLNEGLFVDDTCVAKVEAFADDGPYYGNALTPDGEHQRSGPMRTQADAMDWCQAAAGLTPMHREATP